MKFHVTIDHVKDGIWIVECPAIPGCVSWGENEDEAPRTIEVAIFQ